MQLSKAPGVADTVQKIAEGVIRNVSVGYWIHKVVKTEADDQSFARWDVVDWEPLEISAVPIPADPGSQIRSAQENGGTKPALRSCEIVTASSSANKPKPPATQENRMATRKPKAATRGSKTPAELEAERKRAAAAATRAAAKRDADEDEDKDEERDADDEDKDERDGEEADEGRDADDKDEKDGDDEDGDERDGDDADEENEAEDGDEDGKRGAGKTGGKRAATMTPADVRKAAEKAVRADRERGAGIREIAARFGFPKLGEKHANGETSVRAFKDLVLERLAKRQEQRGDTTFAASGSRDADRGFEAGAGAKPALGRDFDKGADEFRSLLGKKKP